jgi:hypothetical protein
MRKEMLYYDCLTEFNNQYYSNLLTEKHIKSDEINLGTLTNVSGYKDEEANFWGYIFEKAGKKYLLSSHVSNEEKIDLRSVLPIRVVRSEKVAHKGVVYHEIKEYKSFRIRPEQTMTFKELIDFMSSLGHTNPRGLKLIWMMEFTQMFNRANFRISSPAGFGKDSVVDTVGNLIGGAGTIESPSLAKLEERANVLKHLAVSEVVDMTKADWRHTQQFLLAVAAFKPKVTKHSRAYGGVGEEIDIDKFSLSLLYNDIDHYPEHDKYFDYVTKEQVLDRFPAFRLYGVYTESFGVVDVEEFVEQNIDNYVKLLRALLYYGEVVKNNKYEIDIDEHKSSRWKTNIGRLLSTVSHYCESEEEFKDWCNYIDSCQDDYKTQLEYPEMYKKLKKKLNVADFTETTDKIKKMNSVPFKAKLDYINSILRGDADYKDVPMKSIW